MNESLLSKTKGYSIKIPRELIEKALAAFLQEAGLTSSSEALYSLFTIEIDGESWGLPSQELFLSEYTKDITSAKFSIAWKIDNKQIVFGINFFHDYSGNPSTRIEITLDSRAAIDHVFSYFQEFYDLEAQRVSSTSSQPAVSSYSLTRRLPSSSIQPQVLQKLEALLIGFASELERGDKSGREHRVQISIEDSQGCESLPSIAEYTREYFPNDARRISIRLSSLGPDSLKIQFDIDRQYTIIEVTRQSKNSRSEVRKTVGDVLHILEDYKNGNWFFNPPFPIGYLINLLSYGVLGLAIAALRIWPALPAGALSIYIGIQLYLISCKVKPYSQFHTKRNERIAQWFNWFVFALVEFILFTVAATTIVSRLSGR